MKGIIIFSCHIERFSENMYVTVKNFIFIFAIGIICFVVAFDSWNYSTAIVDNSNNNQNERELSVFHTDRHEEITLDKSYINKSRNRRRLANVIDQNHENQPKAEESGSVIHRGSASIIRCENQTRCISPTLQVKQLFKIYYCNHRKQGVRFYYQVRESLLLHPYVQLVPTPEEADYIVYLPVSSDWGKSECNKVSYMNKTIILDEGDYPQLFEPDKLSQIWDLYPKLKQKKTYYHMYFKRSCVKRIAGEFKHYMNYFKAKSGIFPMTYTIMEAYVRNSFTRIANRDYDIVCTLRGSKQDPARLRVQEWVKEYGESRHLKNYIAGQVNHASRTTVDGTYFGRMQTAQIIVSCNPSNWEGDFRFMEAMASGALVFVDIMATPRPNALINEKHVIYYDNKNKTAFFEKLDFYRSHLKAARRVAVEGYLHAMEHHRAANLIDYVLRTVLYRQDYENWLEASKHPIAQSSGDQGNYLEESLLAHNSSASIVTLPSVPPFHSAYTETGFDMKRTILKKLREQEEAEAEKKNKNWKKNRVITVLKPQGK